ncbi:MAG: DUF6338 family protein [Methanosarcina barkeri]|nr:DUF6338 family protein [Methanosarcina sp. ERenArc_MAG2]
MWQPDNLFSFIVFFIPGFIALKIYDLKVPSERRDFSKSFIDAIVYSGINYLILYYPLMSFIDTPIFYQEHKVIVLICFIFVILIIPVLWPILYLKIRRWKPISSRIQIPHPFLRPWDFLFDKGKPLWIIVHLKDGRLTGGPFQGDSFASTYPAEEQIYLEKVWKLDENGNFLEPLERSKGIIILKDEIAAIQFFENEV